MKKHTTELGSVSLGASRRLMVRPQVCPRLFCLLFKPVLTSNTEGEDANGVSRASSVSAKDRPNAGGKKKTNRQRRDDSESFDSRSQYVVFCGGPQQPGTWAQAQPQYYPMNGSPYNGQFQQPYQAALQPYGPNQPYPPQMMPPNNSFTPPYNGMGTVSCIVRPHDASRLT